MASVFPNFKLLKTFFCGFSVQFTFTFCNQLNAPNFKPTSKAIDGKTIKVLGFIHQTNSSAQRK